MSLSVPKVGFKKRQGLTYLSTKAFVNSSDILKIKSESNKISNLVGIAVWLILLLFVRQKPSCHHSPPSQTRLFTAFHDVVSLAMARSDVITLLQMAKHWTAMSMRLARLIQLTLCLGSLPDTSKYLIENYYIFALDNLDCNFRPANSWFLSRKFK